MCSSPKKTCLLADASRYRSTLSTKCLVEKATLSMERIMTVEIRALVVLPKTTGSLTIRRLQILPEGGNFYMI